MAADGGKKKICLKDESPILFNQSAFAEHFSKFEIGVMKKHQMHSLCAWIALYEPYTYIYCLSPTEITTTVFSITAVVAPIQSLSL